MGAVRGAGARPAGDRREGRRLSRPPSHRFELLVLEAPACELVDHSRLRAELAEAGLGDRRLLVTCRPTGAALVLGSTQPTTEVDERACEALGAAIVRRRSGGGAVFVAPYAQVWVDVFLPTGDPLLERDVGRAFGWLGRAWAAAIVATGAEPGDLAVAAPVAARDPWGRRLCFAAVGSGEVTRRGRKVVGISQRRDREGAWLYSMVPLQDTSARLVGSLALSETERAEAARLLQARAGVVEAREQALLDALGEALPDGVARPGSPAPQGTRPAPQGTRPAP